MLYAYNLKDNKILNIQNIYLIKNGKIIDNLMCFNTTTTTHTRHDNSTYENDNTYFKLYFNCDLKKVNKATIEKAKQGNKSFYITTGKDYSGVATYDLYLNADLCDFVESEISSEYHKGDKSIQKRFDLTLKNAFIEYNETDYRFKKATDKIESGEKNAEKISECLERLEQNRVLFKRDNSAFIEEHENALKNGYDYRVFFEKKAQSNKLVLKSYVYKHEKSAERIKIEKLANDIKTLIGDKLSIYDIDTLLNHYKITKIRKH